MLTVEQIESVAAGSDLDKSLGEWLGLGSRRPSQHIHDAYVAAATRCIPTAGATRFRQGLTFTVQFNPARDLAVAWFIDNETGTEFAHASADVPELAICRSLLKLKNGHF